MKKVINVKSVAVTMALLVLLSMTAMATTGRYDQQIQQAVSQKMQAAKQLQAVHATVEDGIVTLTGTVNLYQDKLDAGKKAKKLSNVSGVATTSRSREKTFPTPSCRRNCRSNWLMIALDITTTPSTMLRSACKTAW